MVIDLSRLNDVTVLDRTSRLVRLGAGARWAKVAGALAPAGLAISSGDHGNVGVGGLATGGGVGWLVRSYVLTIDHVRAVDVLLADGSLVRADADHEPDLYWAMRGGGQGMAIALAFEIEAVELGQVGVAQVVVEADRDGAVLHRWSEVMGGAPRSWSTAMFLTPHGRSFAAQVTAVVADDDKAALLRLGHAFRDVGRILAQHLQMAPYPALVPAAHLQANLGRQRSSTTNGLFGRLDTSTSRSLMDVVAHSAQPLVQLRSLGGAVNDVDPDATAYAHRHQEALVTVSTFLPSGRDQLDEAWSEAAGRAGGAYTNFESEPSPQAHERASPGATGRRLRDLLARFDPERVLGGETI